MHTLNNILSPRNANSIPIHQSHPQILQIPFYILHFCLIILNLVKRPPMIGIDQTNQIIRYRLEPLPCCDTLTIQRRFQPGSMAIMRFPDFFGGSGEQARAMLRVEGAVEVRKLG